MALIAQFGLFNGILALVLIMVYNFRRNNNRIFIGLSIFFVWYTLFIVHLTLTRQIIDYPVLHRTGIITAYLAIPFLYIYSRNLFYPGNLWRKADWIFLLPAIVYLVDYMPFFILSGEQKVAILQENLASDARIFLAGEGWMGFTGLYFPFAYVWIAVIMYFQVRLIIKNRKLETGFKSVHNRRLFNFIIAITLLYIPIFIPGVFGILFRLSWFNPNFIGVSFGLSLSAVSIYLFISPHILYGFIPERRFASQGHPDSPLVTSEIEEKTQPMGEEKAGRKEDDSQPVVSEDEIDAEKEIVLKHMQEQKPFLRMGYSIQDLSNETGIPVYQLSPLINGHFNMNFANWVNRFRIEYLIELVPENPQLTLEAVSKKAGFISRSTFINAFKKEKGVTPREYFKGQKSPD
jgi:AraC-like DNA-binding protein